MPNLNCTILIGHLTDEPELKHIQSGAAVCEVAIAVNRKHKDKEETLFMPVTIWGKTAENVAKYMHKGSCMMVQGFLRQENWQAQDGSKRTTIKLVAEDVQFMGKPATASPGNTAAGSKKHYPLAAAPENTPSYTVPPRAPVNPEYAPPEQNGGNAADDIPF